jgi:capsular polysaccharide biosynthesis protein
MEGKSLFNLLDIVALVKKWLWHIIAIVGICTAAAIAVAYMLPKQYKAQSTILASNTVLTDKSRFFNANIQYLYSALGGGSDLDRIYATASLDTTYKFLIDSFNLVQYFKMGGDPQQARNKTIKLLQKKIELSKTENGELKITFWDKDKNLAASLVNVMVSKVHEMDRQTLNLANREALEQMQRAFAKTEADYLALNDSIKARGIDPASAAGKIADTRKRAMEQRMEQFQQQIGELDFVANANTASLVVIEKAYPPAIHDKPRKMKIAITALLLSTVFALLVIAVLERRKP